jgi:hypothetical protein
VVSKYSARLSRPLLSARLFQPTRVMRAEEPVEFEPAALRRDRGRRRDLRARREMRERAERVFWIPGADDY